MIRFGDDERLSLLDIFDGLRPLPSHVAGAGRSSFEKLTPNKARAHAATIVTEPELVRYLFGHSNSAFHHFSVHASNTFH